jgi:hypothetical protein
MVHRTRPIAKWRLWELSIVHWTLRCGASSVALCCIWLFPRLLACAVTVGDLRSRLNARGHVDGDGAPDAGCLRLVVRTSASGGVEFGLVKGQWLYLTLGL